MGTVSVDRVDHDLADTEVFSLFRPSNRIQTGGVSSAYSAVSKGVFPCTAATSSISVTPVYTRFWGYILPSLTY